MAKRRTIIHRGVLIAILLLLSLCSVWLFRDDQGTSPTAAGAAVDDLPADATDVAWFLPGAFKPHTMFEFTTSEAGYEQWVHNRSRPKLDGPKRGRIGVLRYDRTTHAVVWREFQDAIAYTWNEADRGVQLVYEPDQRRAYYWSHSRWR